MPRNLIWVTFLVAIAVALGCAKPEDKFVGAYHGKFQLSSKQEASIRGADLPSSVVLSDKDKQTAEDLITRFNSITGTLTLNSNKTAVMETTAKGGTRKSGTWSFEGSQVVILEDGKSADSAQHLSPSADGKTLTYKEWTWTKS